MYNCLVVTVLGSTFENNHAQSFFTDLPSRVSGGGLSITIKDTRNNSMTTGRFSYTIQNCTFTNNSANSTVPPVGTTSVLEGGHINGRGGGVAFYVLHPSVVEIRVLCCHFINNYASAFGGGLYIASPELFTEENFTIADNTFERNEARSGGGIVLGTAVLKEARFEYLKKDILTVSVVFSRNTFLWNRAMPNYGGALFIAPGELGC